MTCSKTGFFFFKQKTAYEILRSDWSSDVCSSDLIINCLVNTAKRLGVKIQCNHQLTAITELEDERLLLDFKISKGKGDRKSVV